jgi:hypothetical protein
MALVELGRFGFVEASVLVSALEAAGIPAFAFDIGTHVAEGSLMFLPVRVMVDEQDLTDAVALHNSAA